MRRLKLFLLCLLALCVLSFLHHYRALHEAPRLQDVPSHLKSLKSLKSISGFFWQQSTTERKSVRVTSELTVRKRGEAEVKLHERTFLLRDDTRPFFIRTEGGELCLGEGSVRHHPERHCLCRPGWHGPHCGIPTVVQHSNLASKARLRPRAVPRRLINAINVNHEFDLLHARFHELADAVDVFLVCESNFTAYGDPRPLHFQRLLLNGTLDYIRHKILYVFLDHFPAGGRADGWIADDYLRTYLTRNGVSRLRGLKPSDVFVLNDADEIPAREGLLFLKLYDGWTEPFSIHLRKSLYGFFWRQLGSLDVLSGCTADMLLDVYRGDGILLRRRSYYTVSGFREYENRTGRVLSPWALGSPVHFAGWHCSWCFRPEGIYYKLLSAQNGDFPRWGDYSEKRKIRYIQGLIRTGGWFDGSRPSYPPSDPREHMYAPKYFLRNYDKYRHLLENPYAREKG